LKAGGQQNIAAIATADKSGNSEPVERNRYRDCEHTGKSPSREAI